MKSHQQWKQLGRHLAWVAPRFAPAFGVALCGALVPGCQTVQKAADSGITAVETSESPLLAPLNEPYVGIGVSVLENLPEDKAYTSRNGLRVDWVLPWAPAWDAGIQINDILLSADGVAFDHVPPENMVLQFAERIKTMQKGKTSLFRVLRWKTRLEFLVNGSPEALPASAYHDFNFFSQSLDPSRKYTIQWKPEYEILSIPLRIQGRRISSGPKVLPSDAELHPEWAEWASETSNSPVASVAAEVARQAEFEPALEELRGRLASLTVAGDPFRIPEVSYLQRNPFRIRQSADRVLEQLSPKKDETRSEAVRRILSAANRLIHPTLPQKFEFPRLRAGLPPKQHLSQIETVLSHAEDLWKKAFRNLSSEEIEFLRSQSESLFSSLELVGAPYQDSNRARLIANLRAIQLAAKVDLFPLHEAAQLLLRIADRKYIDALKKDFKSAGLDLAKEIVATRETPYGKIVIAGTSDNVHREVFKEKPAVLIDLGGNDFYADRAASTYDGQHFSLCIDLEGDDSYESVVNYAQGAGFLGVAILADFGGNDSYLARKYAQGFSYLGVGVLIDESGDDRYRAVELSQGAAHWGSGILADYSGDDEYEAELLSQGAGVVGGVGVLYDHAGNDRYFAKGGFPSDSGTAGTFNSLSQGVGYGSRGIASGGVGILYDAGGKDRLEAGDFSQGGGYYFGWGILKAGGNEDDVYVGSRYNQGFSAHYALGTFLEDGGNDRYETRHSAATGVSTDLSITWFEDRAGNDAYRTGEFSVGSSAHNSLTVFLDRAGKDRYVGPRPPAASQSNTQEKGGSLSLFMDLGGDLDRSGGDGDFYSQFRNNQMTVTSASGDIVVRIDSPKTLEQLSDPGAARNHLRSIYKQTVKPVN